MFRYYDVDTPVYKTAHTICPSQRDIKPTLTYVLEVFQLGTGKWPDRVVAWTGEWWLLYFVLIDLIES